MGRKANGPRHCAASTRLRYCALTIAVALPLMLNASNGLMSTASGTAIPRARATPHVLPQPPLGMSDIAAQLSVRQAAMSESVAAARTVKVSSPKGTRSWTASSLTDNGLPSAAKRAYVNAARTMATLDEACRLPWTLLAGIGRVESDHGRYDGAVLGVEGVSRPLIIGVALDGVGPVAAIRDSDNGRLDRDKVWDRAVGPMQFIPSTWAGAAADGDGDGLTSPHDISDAALAAAAYLCSGSGSVLGQDAMRAAIFRYNQSADYVALVIAMEAGYRTGVFILPSVLVERDPAADRARKKRIQGRNDARRGDAERGGTRGPGKKKPSGSPPSPKPSSPPGDKPSGGNRTPNPSPQTPPKPKPPPAPPPSPKPPEALSGVLVTCGGGWCIGTMPLDLGSQEQLEATAAHDYDAIGGVQTNALELGGLVAAGMSGPPVDLLVAYVGRKAVVYTINAEDYRFGDGTFVT